MGRITFCVVGCGLFSAISFAQSAEEGSSREDDVFIEQAPRSAPSIVYFPDEALDSPSDVGSAARTGSPARKEESVSRDPGEQSDPASGFISQVGNSTNGTLDQLSDGASARMLEQLSEVEREVLLDAVEGTDICERVSDIPAIKALCEDRLETRSDEFAPIEPNRLSLEERLLGEGLDADRLSTLEAAIRRLATNTAGPDDFSSQMVASVALQGSLSSVSQPSPTDQREAQGLTAESQALIEAIVNQFGPGGGGPP
ncbi:MAG: hypothetical protein V2I43_11735 [Parvularcula sp.]|jgi:hypothetical protein|nr:hypothetical protein [Parvularcula sp.]